MPTGNSSGIIGQIPKYSVVDISLSYSIKNMKFESGVNNLLDSSYYNRRAVGYLLVRNNSIT